MLQPEWNTSFARGMNDSAAAVNMRPDEARYLLNYRITPDGQAIVRRGSRRTHPTQLNGGAQCFGSEEYRTQFGVVQWLQFYGDSAYVTTDEGVTYTEVATGLHENYWSMVSWLELGGGARYLLCANGGPNVYTWDGTTFAVLTEIAAIGTNIKFLAVHNNRVWAYITGVTVYGCALDDFRNWIPPDALQMQVIVHDDASDLTALHPFGSILAFGKRKSIAYTDGFGPSDLIIGAGPRGLSRDVGILSWRSIASDGHGIFFLSERGFEYMPESGQPQLISVNVQRFMRQVNWEAIRVAPALPQGVFHSRHHTYECLLPGATTVNDYRFVYRPPIADQPPATTLFQQSVPAGTALGVFVNESGYLETTDGVGFQMRIIGAYLGLAGTMPGVGMQIVAPEFYLDVAIVASESAVLFTADKDTFNQAVIGGGYDGFTRQLDIGGMDNVPYNESVGTEISAQLLSRSFQNGQPFKKKRARSVRVLVNAPTSEVLQLRVVGDGVPGPFHTILMPNPEGDVAKAVRARVGGRAYEHQVQLLCRTSDTRFSGIALDSETIERL